MNYLKMAQIVIILRAVAICETFNQIHVYDNQWRMSSDFTQAQFQRRLFGATNSITAFGYLTERGSLMPVVAASDPLWNRMVYSVYQHVWMHGEYGHNHAGQYDGICGLASSPERLVFAADRCNNKVHVLYFNHESMPALGVVATGSGPTDVCYDDGGTAAFGDDFFWVANSIDGTVKKYSYSFDPVYLTFECNQCAILTGLDNPISISRGRESNNLCQDCDPNGHNEWLYVLEASGTIKCFINNQVPPNNDPNIQYQFSYYPINNTLLTSIAVDHSGLVWGTDGYNSQLVTYYNNGSELIETDRIGNYGVDNVPGQLAVPTDISFAEAVGQDIFDPNILHVHVDSIVFVQEIWSQSTGGVRGKRGVSIRNLAAQWVYPRDYENRLVEISYFTTAFASNIINIKNSSNQIIRSISRSDIPGDVALIWDGKDNNGGQAPIDLYTIDLRGNTIQFNTNAPPSIDYCWFDPMYCFDGDDYWREIQAIVSDPDDETNFRYYWRVNEGGIHLGSNHGILFQELNYNSGNNSRICFHPPLSWLSDLTHTIKISLYVYDQTQNPLAQYYDATSIDAKRCVECPFLYITNGPDTLCQNNILNASIDTSGGGNLVFDYLFLTNDPVPNSGNYEFFIREDDNATDSLDWAGLVTIDHEPGGQLMLSRKGTLYDVLLSISPSAAIDDRGVDALQDLLYSDGVYYTREDSGWLDLTYEGLDTLGLALESTASGTGPGGTGKTPTGMAAERPNPNILTISVKDSLGSWHEIERVFARRRPQRSFVDLTNYFSPSMQVRYKWSVCYSVDRITYNWVKPIINGVNFHNPNAAFLNDSLDVLNILRRPDKQFAGFNSGEYVSLRFPYQLIPENKERDFVFVCRGKYDPSDSLAPPKPEGEELPKRFSLFQNYPNPFNSTTIINFDLPEPTQTSLVIYNILGQLVATPVDAALPAGPHSIVWDGRNQSGTTVASGIYFYVISTDEHRAVKKMLLLK